MSGFTAIFSKNNFTNRINTKKKFPNENLNNFIQNKISTPNFYIEQYTVAKFTNEKILEEDDQVVISTDGVLLNLNELKTTQKVNSVFTLIKSLYNSKGERFVNELRGDFSGIIYDKTSNKCFVFTNHTGSKRIFYAQHGDYFICSSDLNEITHLMDVLKIKKNLNEYASYFLLTCGFMLDEHTLVNEVKRLNAGCYLIFQDNKIRIENYFHLRNIKKTTDNKTQIINSIDELFNNAVRLQYEKDLEYGYKHTATLSGGLDSRMTILTAHKLGYKEQMNFTFSHKGYLEERIAKNITEKYKFDYKFISLGNGSFLKEIDANVNINDGLISYSGAAHAFDSIKQIDFKEYGIIHTGLIGDAVIGSFLSAPYAQKPKITDGMYSTKLVDKIKDVLFDITKKFDNEELYKFYSRGFLGAMNGNYTFDLISQAVSPFLDVDFLSYCYSIPENLKYKQQIYLDWIREKHKEFAKFPWEKTGISPLKSNSKIKYLHIEYYHRMSMKLINKTSGKLLSGMNPFDLWLKKNNALASYIEQYFHEHIVLLNDNRELQNDCIKLFHTGNAGEKFQVLTLLSAIKLHRIDS
ncbi:hypothetical protein MASR2M117_01710 [Paludibacter sp.]